MTPNQITYTTRNKEDTPVVLFYPCAGKDVYSPIRQFANTVTDFVFVDIAYFSRDNYDLLRTDFAKSADRVKPVLGNDADYLLLDTHLSGPPIAARRDYLAAACQRTETYLHWPTRRQIRIHRIREQGLLTVFRLPCPISVFYYRGDSHGEGGSGDLWLSEPILSAVLGKMAPGGHVVTDGSNTAAGGKRDNFSWLKGPSFHQGMRLEGDLGFQLTFLDTHRLDKHTTYSWQLSESPHDPLLVARRQENLRHVRDHLSRTTITKEYRERPDDWHTPINLHHRPAVSLAEVAKQLNADSPVAMSLRACSLPDGCAEQLALLQGAAARGFLPALRLIAEHYDAIYQRDRTQRHAADNAMQQWHQLASQGDARAQYRCVELHHAGIALLAVEDSQSGSDERRVQQLRIQSARQGHAPAIRAMIDFHEKGADGQAPDLLQAAYWLDRLAATGETAARIRALRLRAKVGDPQGQFRLAQRYEDGHGVGRDLLMAAHWYQCAAQRGHKLAEQACNRLLAEQWRSRVRAGVQLSPMPPEDQRAIEAAARDGDENACWVMAHLANAPDHEPSRELSPGKTASDAESGDHPPLNRYWLDQITSARGLAEVARLHIARFTRIPDDTAHAAEVAEAYEVAKLQLARLSKANPKIGKRVGGELRAALLAKTPAHLPPELIQAFVTAAQCKVERTDARLNYQLAQLWDAGLCLPQDRTRAFYWYQRAAHRGHVDAMVALSQHLRSGHTRPADLPLALSWLRKAAKRGHAGALDELITHARAGNRYAQRAVHDLAEHCQHYRNALPEAPTDELLRSAVARIAQHHTQSALIHGPVSFLQRHLCLGYEVAVHLIGALEVAGVLSAPVDTRHSNSSQSNDVLIARQVLKLHTPLVFAHALAAYPNATP